jgi:2Fe-2S ferredoxin
MTSAESSPENSESGRPGHSYSITFLPANATFQVNPDRLPYGHHGRPGSILDVASAAGVTIEHACGGFGACATCHVIVRQGLDSCAAPSEEEQDRLDEAFGVTPLSRLACQCVPDGSADVVVELPRHGRNAVD